MANIKHLATELDKNNNSVEVMHTDTIGMSPVYTFFLKHMAELIDNGLAWPVTTWDDFKCGAIYLTENNEILGHIVYDTEKPGMLWIVLSAVRVDCRNRGLYKIMHKHFEQLAKDMGKSGIMSHVHKNNTARLKSAESVGMGTVFYCIGKRL